jgi:hypothetical protein
MDEKFRKLIELGAGEFEHVNGTLIAHLEGTRCMLKEWGAAEVLQQAGLYHAAYGTVAFEQNVFELGQRKDVADIIGSDAENIVYHYCACDRERFFAQFGLVEQPLFFDRITAKELVISTDLLGQLCELTAANEIEIALGNPEFIRQHGAGLLDLFNKMAPYLSAAAQRKVQHVFANTIHK